MHAGIALLWTWCESVTSNLVRAIDCSDKRRGDRMCTVRYDVYSNSPSSKCIVSLMCTLFYIGVHAVKVDWTEQNAQYFIGQSIATSTEWYTSLGTESFMHRWRMRMIRLEKNSKLNIDVTVAYCPVSLWTSYKSIAAIECVCSLNGIMFFCLFEMNSWSHFLSGINRVIDEKFNGWNRCFHQIHISLKGDHWISFSYENTSEIKQ
jgi:hypothetical protein